MTLIVVAFKNFFCFFNCSLTYCSTPTFIYCFSLGKEWQTQSCCSWNIWLILKMPALAHLPSRCIFQLPLADNHIIHLCILEIPVLFKVKWDESIRLVCFKSITLEILFSITIVVSKNILEIFLSSLTKLYKKLSSVGHGTFVWTLQFDIKMRLCIHSD